jgi:hypothetical protein
MLDLGELELGRPGKDGAWDDGESEVEKGREGAGRAKARVVGGVGEESVWSVPNGSRDFVDLIGSINS